MLCPARVYTHTEHTHLLARACAYVWAYVCCVQHVCTHRTIDEETEDAPGWSPGGERGSHSASALGARCFGDVVLDPSTAALRMVAVESLCIVLAGWGPRGLAG